MLAIHENFYPVAGVLRDVTAEHAHPSPFSRLIQLLRPDARDIGIVVIYAAVVGVIALATPIAVEQLVTTVAFGALLQPIVVLAFILFTFLSFGAAITTLQTYVVEMLQRRIAVRVVSEAAHRLAWLRVPSLDHRYGPELVNRVFEVVTVQKAVAYLLLDGVGMTLQTLVGMVVLAFYHPALLGFNLFLVVALVTVLFLLGRNAVTTATLESRSKYAFVWWLEELARHPLTFKLRGSGDHALEMINHLMDQYISARAAHFRVLMRQIVFSLGIQVIASTALLGLGGWLVIEGELTLGQLIAAELIVATIMGAFSKLGKHLDSFYDLLAACEKLGYLFDLPVERDHGAQEPPISGPRGVSILVRGVVVDRGDGAIIGPLQRTIKSGERLALTGAPGSGRSTLLEVLFCVRPPDTGFVEMDGADVRELCPQTVRDQLALVGPIEIFAGTIAQNVILDRPNHGIAELSRALAAVDLLDEIQALPRGFQTKSTTDGAPLSDSQCRRLMLARAVLDEPKLLLIDNLLDTLPDEYLETAADYLFAPERPWTLVLATGRKELIERCDQIWRLDSARKLNRNGGQPS